MLGFIFPVVIWGVFQALISLLLLAPLPIARVAIRLCKATQTPVGKTFMASVSVFLLVLLVPPVSSLRRFEGCLSCNRGAALALSLAL